VAWSCACVRACVRVRACVCAAQHPMRARTFVHQHHARTRTCEVRQRLCERARHHAVAHNAPQHRAQALQRRFDLVGERVERGLGGCGACARDTSGWCECARLHACLLLRPPAPPAPAPTHPPPHPPTPLGLFSGPVIASTSDALRPSAMAELSARASGTHTATTATPMSNDASSARASCPRMMFWQLRRSDCRGRSGLPASGSTLLVGEFTPPRQRAAGRVRVCRLCGAAGGPRCCVNGATSSS
jgi:hypothetical protein